MSIPKKTLKQNPDGTVSMGKSGINRSLGLGISKRYVEAKKKVKEAKKKATS
jgi:hypothetical protein